MPNKQVWPLGQIRGPYNQRSARAKTEALFLDNIGRIVTRAMIISVLGTNARTGEAYENWHQRLSELRTDMGYTILSNRDDPSLAVGEYVMPSPEKRAQAGRRVTPTRECWQQVLDRAANSCEWAEDGQRCSLAHGDTDPVGGGTVRLTPDHSTPHSVSPNSDPQDPSKWRALCGRHQVMKKNYWDDATGKLNLPAILQAASKADKVAAYQFLRRYFGDAD